MQINTESKFMPVPVEREVRIPFGSQQMPKPLVEGAGSQVWEEGMEEGWGL